MSIKPSEFLSDVVTYTRVSSKTRIFTKLRKSTPFICLKFLSRVPTLVMSCLGSRGFERVDTFQTLSTMHLAYKKLSPIVRHCPLYTMAMSCKRASWPTVYCGLHARSDQYLTWLYLASSRYANNGRSTKQGVYDTDSDRVPSPTEFPCANKLYI